MAIAPTGSLLFSDNVKKYVDNYYDLTLFDEITQAVSMFPLITNVLCSYMF